MNTLPDHIIPISNLANYNSLWEIVSDVFTTFGAQIFGHGYFGGLVVFVLLVSGARFVWKWVKGVL